MNIFVQGILVVVLWAISNVICQHLFGRLPTCLYTASVIFSWWFVAYFTKEFTMTPVSLCLTYVFLALAIFSAHYAGYYGRVFPNVPTAWNGSVWWMAYLVLAFVMLTPLMFNWAYKSVIRLLR